MYKLYEVRCKTPNTFYVGITTNHYRRSWQHRTNRGALFIRKHGFHSMQVVDEIPTIEEARKKELEYVRYLFRYGLNVSGAAFTSEYGYATSTYAPVCGRGSKTKLDITE